MHDLIGRIESRQARVVVVGAGYVGLPLAVELASEGFDTTALDRDERKVERINAGSSYVSDVEAGALASNVAAGRLTGSTDPTCLASADAVVVCVPTPLNKTKDPDMRFIVEAADDVVRHQHPNMLIVLESTTYPGTTTEVLVPKLTERGFALGEQVFVAFSPERVDPGNRVYKTRNTPKVLGGATPACLRVATALYSTVVDTLVPVSSTECAEMVKLLENTFRAVNIGLVNEVAIMSRRLGLDPFEVIRAAASKPFGFMPFYPGPGLGGHCIPIDPLYLSWKLRTLKYQARFIELADAINSSMPGYVVDRVKDALNGESRAVKGSKVLVYGVAYKRDVPDVRESPALDIIMELRALGAAVQYMDPHVPRIQEDSLEMESVAEDASFGQWDVVVIVTDHSRLDTRRLVAEAKVVVDTRDALHGMPESAARIHGL